MILLAALIGAACGAVIIGVMYRLGMLAERSGAAVLLAAIALFYPVFAAAEGNWISFTLHAAIFVGFAMLAARAYTKGMLLLAGGLIAHGIFDIAIGVIAAPGPAWWPAFCAALDIVAGVMMIKLIQQKKIAS